MNGAALREYNPPHPIPMGSARWDEAFRTLVDMRNYAADRPLGADGTAWTDYHGALRLFAMLAGDTASGVDRQVKQAAKAPA